MASFVQAQDLQQEYAAIKKNTKENPLAATGSIGASAVFYNAQNIAPRRDPFYWVLNANLSIKILDKIDVPFSAVITQQDKNFVNGIDKFSQPFNQFGISPRYKWLTVHAGYRSLELSQYSLSGAIFLGGAVEVKPKRARIQSTVLHGRFVKAVPKGGVAGVIVSLPSYERNGTAAKIRAGDENNYFDLVMMQLRDDKQSLVFDTSLANTPMENKVLAINVNRKFKDKIKITGEWAYSLFTDNLYQDAVVRENNRLPQQIMTMRPSTRFNQALNISADFQIRKIEVGLAYKHIDPDYRSLGAIFLTNDVEETSAHARFTLFKNKINGNLAAGVQHNNLDKVQNHTSRRLIGSAELTCQPIEQVQLSASFSNFSSNTIPVRNVISDSIQLVQVARTQGFNFNYRIDKSALLVILLLQAQSQNSIINQTSTGKMSTLAASSSWQFKKPMITLTTGINMNSSGFGQNSSTGFGPNATVSKTLGRGRFRVSYSFSQQLIKFHLQEISTVYNHFLNSTFRLTEKQNIKLDIGLLEKKSKVANTSGFREFRGTVGYQLTFSANKKTFTR